MTTSVSARLNEAAGAVFYPVEEIHRAILESQRLFALLTLSLQSTAAWSVPAATTFFSMTTIFSDWIVPLRLQTAAGAKVRTARLETLAALDPLWPSSPGAPTRYAIAGVDLLALYKQPATAGTVLSVTYARAPVALAADGDISEFPSEYHPEFISYAIYRCRQAEGADALASALPLLTSYLAAANSYAAAIRTRNKGSGFDRLPIELSEADISKLVGTAKTGRKP